MENSRTVKTHSWLFSFLMLIIPGINIIYLISLALGLSHYDSKISLARALIVVLLVIIVCHFGFIVIKLSINGSTFETLGQGIKEYYINIYNNLVESIKSFKFKNIFNSK